MRKILPVVLAAFPVSIILSAPLEAQTPTPTVVTAPKNTLVFEGVGNDVDKEHRNPLLTVGIKRGTNVVTLLADATVQHDEFMNSPIQFDFYVNRKFLESQLRSKALPGPIGVDVSAEVAALPFNYTVVAKVIHPNRQFTTMIEGAVFASDYNATLDCTLTLPVDDASSKIYSQNDSKMVQVDNESFSINLEGLATSSGASNAVLLTTVKVKPADNSVTATLSITEGDAEIAKVVEASGSISLSDGILSSVSLSSLDGETTLECE